MVIPFTKQKRYLTRRNRRKLTITKAQKKTLNAYLEMSKDLGRSPTFRELAHERGVSVATAHEQLTAAFERSNLEQTRCCVCGQLTERIMDND